MQEAVKFLLFLSFSIQESSSIYASSSIMAQMDDSCKKERPAHTGFHKLVVWGWGLPGFHRVLRK
jgi:hypothetical protein